MNIFLRFDYPTLLTGLPSRLTAEAFFFRSELRIAALSPTSFMRTYSVSVASANFFIFRASSRFSLFYSLLIWSRVYSTSTCWRAIMSRYAFTFCSYSNFFYLAAIFLLSLWASPFKFSSSIYRWHNYIPIVLLSCLSKRSRSPFECFLSDWEPFPADPLGLAGE